MKAREILSGETNGRTITSGFNENIGRPRNWGNASLFGEPAASRLRDANNNAELQTGTSLQGTYYLEEQEYDFKIWTYFPLTEFVVWSQSQEECLQGENGDGCEICLSRSDCEQ